MMKFLTILSLVGLFCCSVSAQTTPCFNNNPNPTQESFNMTLLANWDDNSLPDRFNGEVVYNDIWGYSAADPSNPTKMRDYAIIGSTEKIHIFDITDTETNSSALVEVANFTGGSSAVWRDFKTRGQYAYCVADEGNEGLIILDMSELPNRVTKVYQSNAFFNRTHNIFIEGDRLYAVGQGGFAARTDVIILDIGTDPANPVLLGQPLLTNIVSNIFNGYVHDIHVKDNIGYCSHINDSVFALWDFSNPTNPVLLDAIDTRGLQHSSWLTKDGRYAIYAEETSNTPLGVVDVSNPGEIELVHEIKMPLLQDEGQENNMAHNPFIKDDYLYVAYYEDGVQVFDVSEPTNPTRVGWYDTQRCNTDYNGTDSNWGVYPFFDSNKIIASDTRNGLFVVMLDENLNNEALPVELVDFTAEVVSEQIELSWMTHSEVSGLRFEIEKQHPSSPERWSAIGNVTAKGNAAEAVAYNMTDESPQAGNNYYRLAQIDADGKISYSETLRVYYHDTDKPVAIYPTVVGTEQRVYLDWNTTATSAATLELVAVDGRLLQRMVCEDIANCQEWSFEELSAGVYWLRVQIGAQVWSERVVKL